MRGYFGIGIYNTKTPANIGTLWRTAHILGAQFIFTIGERYKKQSSDTTKAWKSIPLFEYCKFSQFLDSFPYGAKLIGVEMINGAIPIEKFCHPEKAVYLLGAEDEGIPIDILEDHCDAVVILPGKYCLNVAVAGSIVLYDRLLKGGNNAMS